MLKVMMWLAVIVFLIAIGPILTIWSMNVLFPVLSIPYTLETWAAVIILGAAIRTNVAYKRKN